MAKTNKKRKPRRSALIELVNGALTLFILGIVVIVGILTYGAYLFYAEGKLAEDTTFQVREGAGLTSISNSLANAGIVDNGLVFQLGAQALEKERALKAGEYRIAKGSSMADVLKELTEGTPITYAVTIPEGFTSWQVVQRLLKDENLVGELEEVPAEGSLLPDTYSYERGAERAEIIARMQKQRDEVLQKVWESRQPDLPIKTAEDLLILASVIEKETGIATERPEVAAVFVNRLNQGIRLQSDPTIIYGITKGEGPLGRGLRRSEIKAETPYNTYAIDGLPAGPIANPGIKALEAAANPAESDALFFVAAGAHPSQGHLFAKTYAEHQKNVAAYRKALREAAKAQEKAEADKAKAALQSLDAEQDAEQNPQSDGK